MGTHSFNSGKVRASVRSAIGTAVAVPLLLSAMPAVAQSDQDAIRDLRQQIEALEAKIDDMDTQKMQASSSSSSSSSDGPIRFGNTEVEVGGYFKLDAFYDFESDAGASLGPSDAIAVTDSGDEHVGSTINQSRLTVRTTTPTANGEEIGAYLEADLFGNGGGDGTVQPRVRRIFMTYGNWLAGREWSTFSDFNYGTTLSFYGPQAQLFERQAQVRYKFDVNDSSTMEVALEEPGNAVLTTDADPDFDPADPGTSALNDGSTVQSEDDQLPDLTFRFKNAVGDFSWQFAGVARRLSYDVPGGKEDSEFGWGLDLGGTYSLPTGTTLMASFVGGKGIGRYIYAPAGGADTYVTDSGDLEAIERWGAVGTISQELTPKLTTNLVYGYAESEDLEDASYLTGFVHDKSATYTANLLYTPIDPLTLGIEYFRAEYETQDGTDADANRIQVSTIYNFF